MTSLCDLLDAVLDHPAEEVPVRMLADFLLEQGDGRGEVLRLWLESTVRYATTDRTDFFGDYSDIVTQGGLQSYMMIGVGGAAGRPVFEVIVYGETERRFVVPTSVEEARRIADTYPNPDAIHAFLDRHYSDPKSNVKLRKVQV
jgi:uncharacterized protein (TIGR02996 family)